jgi:phospholipid/cholesterol/gamma-HCH transport system permease protein
MKFLYHLGRYIHLMGLVLKKPEKASIYRRQILIEIDNLGVDSLGIVAIISVFMGGVIALQTAFNIDSPLIPRYTVGYITRQSILLEFSPTIVTLILAGKIGSRMASEIGNMRVSEQIDALEIMGINSAGYLILPKVIAAFFIIPILIIISIFLGIFGGYMAADLTGVVTTSTFLYGLLAWFSPFDVVYALTKAAVFSLIITTVSGYHGFYTQGGALEVGAASTKATVHSSIAIILFDLILTQLMLT